MTDNIIRKIIREESEVKEMGIKINKLISKQPSNYLVKSMKAKEKEKKEKEKLNLKQIKFDSLVESIDLLYDEIRESIKNITWNSLRLYNSGRYYYVIFPRNVITLCKNFNRLYNKIEDIYYNKSVGLKHFKFSAKIETMYGDLQGYMIDFSGLPSGVSGVNLYLDSTTLNRTHFPGGLPPSFLGLNLGVKIYRKMLDDKGFIQSGSDASEAAQNMWRQLIQSPDLSCAISKYGVIVFDKNLNREEKIKYLAEFIFDKYGDESRKRPFYLDKDIFLDSSLASQIGKPKIQRMFSDIFKLRKEKENKTAYEEPFVYDLLQGNEMVDGAYDIED